MRPISTRLWHFSLRQDALLSMLVLSRHRHKPSIHPQLLRLSPLLSLSLIHGRSCLPHHQRPILVKGRQGQILVPQFTYLAGHLPHQAAPRSLYRELRAARIQFMILTNPWQILETLSSIPFAIAKSCARDIRLGV